MSTYADATQRHVPLTVIIAGAVDWNDVEAIRTELAQLPAGSCVIHGDCAGADALGGQIARGLGLRVEAMDKDPLDEDSGTGTGWKRLNERMIARAPDLVLIFHHDFANANGSRHLQELARTRNIKVKVRQDAYTSSEF